MLPEVRIEYAWLLSDHASEGLNKLWGDGTSLRSYDEYVAVAKRYETAWKPYEQKILQGMCDLFGLQFYQNTIDVHIAPWFHAFSSPMVLGVKFTNERFVDVLTHEILHRLLTDNTSHRMDGQNLINDWAEIVGHDHAKNTLIHIPVHAGLKAIFLDVLNEPERLERDIVLCEKYEAYKKAWEYVESHDYRKIIQDLKHFYTDQNN